MENLKKVRSTYPAEFSIGLLLLVFLVSVVMSHQIFEAPALGHEQSLKIYLGMGLVGIAVIVMTLILWEEILFPVQIKVHKGKLLFRNHRTKLKIQLLIFLIIPGVFTYIYMFYELDMIRFYGWAAICGILPIVGKFASGINNYNDFLALSRDKIEYKNNEKEGEFDIQNISKIKLVKEGKKELPKINLGFMDGSELIIDLDEMELDAFYDSIFHYISVKYKHLIDHSEQ